jgi:hypothetical protein
MSDQIKDEKTIPAITTSAKQAELEPWFFPGSGEYKPMTIKAASFEDAVAQWENTKELN